MHEVPDALPDLLPPQLQRGACAPHPCMALQVLHAGHALRCHGYRSTPGMTTVPRWLTGACHSACCLYRSGRHSRTSLARCGRRSASQPSFSQRYSCCSGRWVAGRVRTFFFPHSHAHPQATPTADTAMLFFETNQLGFTTESRPAALSRSSLHGRPRPQQTLPCCSSRPTS